MVSARSSSPSRRPLRDQWVPLVSAARRRRRRRRAARRPAPWWLSRKITGPVLALVERGQGDRCGKLRRAGAGRRRRRRDQPSVRAVQRDGSPAGGDRGARAAVPDVGLARAAHPADRDQGPRRRDPGRAVRRPRARACLARCRRRRDDPARATGGRRARPGEAQRPPVHGACAGGRHRGCSSSAPTRASARRRDAARSTSS